MPSKEFINRKGSVWEQYSFEGKDMPTIRREMEEFVIRNLRNYGDVKWEEGTCGNFCGKWIRPAIPAGNLLYYIHGGGFTLGSSGIPLPFLMEISHRLGLTCFSLDYRLAPEHPFPAAPEDVFSAYCELLKIGYSPEHIVVCGESAGATLSLVLLHQVKSAGLSLPAAVVSMSPVTDAVSGPDRNSDRVLDGLPSIDQVWEVYAPGADLADPCLSPARGDLSGFPPVFLSVGGNEPLLADSLAYTKNAALAGTDIHLHVGGSMIHTYPLDLWDYPEAMDAFEEIELFIRQCLR